MILSEIFRRLVLGVFVIVVVVVMVVEVVNVVVNALRDTSKVFSISFLRYIISR